jgi:hypothetical protein
MTATKPETRIVDAIMRSLRDLPRCWCFKAHGGPYQAAGIPDIVGCLDGRFFAIEVKVPGNRPTRLQELTLSRIAAAGGLAGVATSVEDALTVLDGGDEG